MYYLVDVLKCFLGAIVILFDSFCLFKGQQLPMVSAVSI